MLVELDGRPAHDVGECGRDGRVGRVVQGELRDVVVVEAPRGQLLPAHGRIVGRVTDGPNKGGRTYITTQLLFS